MDLTVSNQKQTHIQRWLDTGCSCGRFRKQLQLIKENIKKVKGDFLSVLGKWECLQRRFSGSKVQTHIMKQMPLISSFGYVRLHIHTSTLYVLWKQTLNPLRESDCVAISGL